MSGGTKAFESEAEMLRALKWQLAIGWDVYEEVKVGASVADLVAAERCSPHRLWILEGKLSRGFAVFEQAASWRRFAHRASVVVPFGPARHHVSMVALAGALGVGILEVGQAGSITESVPAPLNRRPAQLEQLRGCLAPEQRVGAGVYAQAGSRDGARFSPWIQTCRAVETYVHNSPGEALVDVMRAVRHHYPSSSAAISAMRGWLMSGRVRGVEIRKEAGRLRLYPTTPRPVGPWESSLSPAEGAS